MVHNTCGFESVTCDGNAKTKPSTLPGCQCQALSVPGLPARLFVAIAEGSRHRRGYAVCTIRGPSAGSSSTQCLRNCRWSVCSDTLVVDLMALKIRASDHGRSKENSAQIFNGRPWPLVSANNRTRGSHVKKALPAPGGYAVTVFILYQSRRLIYSASVEFCTVTYMPP